MLSEKSKGGRPTKDVDTEVLFDMMEKGTKRMDIAQQLGMSSRTLSRRITEIQEKQGLILQYRALQNLQLTELQATILENITADKIEEAPLRDLVFAYKTLKDKEATDIGKPSDIKGMMHYLIELERRDVAGKEEPLNVDEDVIDIGEMDVDLNNLKETMPNL